MPNPKSDSNGYAASQPDQDRDMGAKGGPSTGLGSPDNKHQVPAPYDSDLQTQIVAKGKKKNKKKMP